MLAYVLSKYNYLFFLDSDTEILEQSQARVFNTDAISKYNGSRTFTKDEVKTIGQEFQEKILEALESLTQYEWDPNGEMTTAGESKAQIIKKKGKASLAD